MEDWKTRITNKISEYDARRTELHKALYSLVEELKRESVVKSGGIELVSDHPLVWQVSVNRKTVQITEFDIVNNQKTFDFDNIGNAVESTEKLSVDDVIKSLLIKHFA